MRIRSCATLGATVIGAALAAGTTSASASPEHAPTPPAVARPHIFPTVAVHGGTTANGTPPLLYNGGPIMKAVQAYTIYWNPAALQDGRPAGMDANFVPTVNRFVNDVGGHSLAKLQTEFYDSAGAHATAQAFLAGSNTDTSP